MDIHPPPALASSPLEHRQQLAPSAQSSPDWFMPVSSCRRCKRQRGPLHCQALQSRAWLALDSWASAAMQAAFSSDFPRFAELPITLGKVASSPPAQSTPPGRCHNRAEAPPAGRLATGRHGPVPRPLLQRQPAFAHLPGSLRREHCCGDAWPAFVPRTQALRWGGSHRGGKPCRHADHS